MREKKREKKLKKALLSNKDFLIRNLQKEWEDIEKSMRKEEFKRELKRRSKEAVVFMTKSVLVLLAIGGALTVAAVAPNMFTALGRLRRHRGFFEKEQFNQTIRSLNKRGLVRSKRSGGGRLLQLTDKGKAKAVEISFKNLRLKPQGEWDRCWRVVLFDIPLKNKWAGEGFRDKLKLMGFYPLQKSVFVSPYPCSEEIDFLCGIYNIRGNVRLIETKTVGEEEKLLDYFSLLQHS